MVGEDRIPIWIPSIRIQPPLVVLSGRGVDVCEGASTVNTVARVAFTVTVVLTVNS